VSTHTNTQAQRPRAAATRRECTSSSACHETAPQPLLKLLRIATAAERLLPLTAAATVQRSAVQHTETQRHSNTATQRHSDTARSLPHTDARGNQIAAYARTPKHTAPQLHTPLYYTPNTLVSAVVTHNGGSALHTRPRLQAAASSAASRHTEHLHHGVGVAVGSNTTAVEHCSHVMHRTCVVPVARCTRSDHRRYHQQHARNTTLPPRSDGMHAYVQRKPRNRAHRHARLNPTNGK
jgi:hypothetical protein